MPAIVGESGDWGRHIHASYVATSKACRKDRRPSLWRAANINEAPCTDVGTIKKYKLQNAFFNHQFDAKLCAICFFF